MKLLPSRARVTASAAATLLLALLSTQALPQTQTQVTTIDNTAFVSYEGPGNDGGAAIEVTSNTVTFTLLSGPSPAIIDFFSYTDPSAPGSVDFPVDGGQCRNDQGDFGPLPDLGGFEGGGAGSPGTAASASRTDQYVAGQTIVVRVEDLNRNEDPAVREFVEITITTSDGDEEVLLLKETGPDTGVFAVAIPSVAIPPPPTPYDCLLSVSHEAELTAVYVDPGFPDDTATTTAKVIDIADERRMVLDKLASVREVSMGDFVRYELVLTSLHDNPVTGVVVTDLLPPGFSYRAGSLRVGGQRVDPDVSADGRSLEIPVGNIAANGRVDIAYVLSVGADAPVGNAVNEAIARGRLGAVSNVAQAAVLVREPFLTSAFTIIGQVIAGSCEMDAAAIAPVPGVRLLLDDGTYVATDANGSYHFEGVRPGTHVVQLDTATLPPNLEVVACRGDTRRAGRAGSEFVEAAGGSLMRVDFRLREKPPLVGRVDLALTSIPDGGDAGHTLSIQASGAPLDALKVMVMLPNGSSYVPGSGTLEGTPMDPVSVSGPVMTFAVGDRPPGWAGNLSFRTEGSCPGPTETKALAAFGAGQNIERTPPASATLTCGPPGAPSGGSPIVHEFATQPAAVEAVSPFQKLAAKRAAMAAEADGPIGQRDWLTGQEPGNDWLLPSGTVASATEAVVVKHLPGHVVNLSINGAPVSGLHASGGRTNAERSVAVAMWRGIPMVPGDNVFRTEVVDASGQVVATLERTLRYSNDVARAELVPEDSLLVADGIHRPVIAVRMLDGAGKPVRAGTQGKLEVAPPYALAEEANLQQQRQLAGMETLAPVWRVEGNEGIAYIELQPTSLSGEATLEFAFRRGDRNVARQEIRAWLSSELRDWIVVGFAKGTIGYDTLSGNLQALDEAGHGDGLSTDGQLSLYAKGRVLGKWLLTVAYDSDKPTDDLRRKALLSQIDPRQFYTLYGDGTQQAYDASSIEKLYLKLERDQFYALFGDFVTGLDDGKLSGYHRTLNGVKVEYQGPVFEFKAFAAETRQLLGRDELQGNGTSGLYRLSQRNIAINGERVRIEVRDRYRSEIVVESKTLARHIDYDIDHAGGTIFFREPIPSRDFDFNPVFIVVDYETHGGGNEYLSAGGRAGAKLLGGRLEAGVTAVRDEDLVGRSSLGALDAKFQVNESTELRAEIASSERTSGIGEESGDAYLVEIEHHGARLDLLGYVQRSDESFGLGQQSLAERGMFKAGLDARWRIGDNFALEGQAWHQENLASGATRNALRVDGQYRDTDWTARAGLQWVRDAALDGRVAESQLLTLGGTKTFGRLQLNAAADIGLGKSDSVDFPSRIELGASYAVTESFRVLVAQEFTDGKDHDTSTTRVGFTAAPWAGATLTSTLNQSQISEFGPRTFGVMGLAQRFVLSERWSVDLSLDGSRSFNESGTPPIVVNPAHPIAAGGVRGVGALTEDFHAVSAGATYRQALWSWTGRIEHRDGETSDRQGFITGFLRQASDGVALGASAQAFRMANADGSQGLTGTAMLSWAWRPLGSRWSILDRLEFRVDELERGAGVPLNGHDTLAVHGDARSRRLVNNFVMNYHGAAWTREDRRGNLFDLAQRSQLSLYYGSKYVFDTYDGEDFSGYTDLLGIDWRHDLTEKLDIGLRGSVRHAWDEGEVSYAFGPSVGFTPFTNAWFSVGYNVIGFDDRDFQAMHYTAQGPYLMLRFKFDQDTFGLSPSAGGGAGR